MSLISMAFVTDGICGIHSPGAMNYIGSVMLETHLKGDVFDLYEKAVQ
jgi:hypothetical protein